jgi:copper chaperone CopZ
MKKFLFLLPLFFACQGPKNSQNAPENSAETSITYNLAVEGMTCTGCENTVINSIKGVDGVTDVSASHETGMVKISVNPDKVDTTAIREKIIEAGYTPVNNFNLIE